MPSNQSWRSQFRDEPLSILMVVVQKHYEYIRHQIGLFDRFNAKELWQMTVVDNSTIRQSELLINDTRCKIVAGVPSDPHKPQNCRASYQHAAALNRYIKVVDTRFLLILDPDFFVIYRNWIRESIDHMLKNKLCFFGAPWHPRWYSKYRSYPAVHFLLIDRERINTDKLDFMPAIIEAPAIGDRWLKKSIKSPETIGTFRQTAFVSQVSKISSGWGWILNILYNSLPLLLSRHRIHSSKDTGWRLWHDFGRKKKYSANIILPVFDIKRDLTKPRHLQTTWGRRLERLFPSRWSFLPAPGTYVTPKRAVGFKLPEFKVLKPECFVWRGAPFAFHLRLHVRNKNDCADDTHNHECMLNDLFEKLNELPIWFLWDKC